jgi:hypothetical protein
MARFKSQRSRTQPLVHANKRAASAASALLTLTGFPLLIMAFGGMNTPENTRDELRLLTLVQLYQNVRAFGFAATDKPKSQPSNNLHIQGKFKTEACWQGDPISVYSLEAGLFFLDFFWLSAGWCYEARGDNTGYGNQWFTTIIPNYFKLRGLVVILPVDKGGLLKNLEAQARGGTGMCFYFMNLRESKAHNPLVRASFAAEQNTAEWANVNQKP